MRRKLATLLAAIAVAGLLSGCEIPPGKVLARWTTHSQGKTTYWLRMLADDGRRLASPVPVSAYYSCSPGERVPDCY